MWSSGGPTSQRGVGPGLQAPALVRGHKQLACRLTSFDFCDSHPLSTPPVLQSCLALPSRDLIWVIPAGVRYLSGTVLTPTQEKKSCPQPTPRNQYDVCKKEEGIQETKAQGPTPPPLPSVHLCLKATWLCSGRSPRAGEKKALLWSPCCSGSHHGKVRGFLPTDRMARTKQVLNPQKVLSWIAYPLCFLPCLDKLSSSC